MSTHQDQCFIYKVPEKLQSFHSCPNAPGTAEIKLAVIGDSGCGKTSLLHSFKTGRPPEYESYIPTIIEHYDSYVTNGRTTYKLSLNDTAGQEDYEGLRTLLYKDLDVIIACYEIDSSDSLNNVIQYWLPEVQRYNTTVPTILVGTKADLKADLSPTQLVTATEEKEIAKEVGSNLIAHLQTSSKTGENVKKTFDVCIAGYINYMATRPQAPDTATDFKRKPSTRTNNRFTLAPCSKSSCCIIV